jgi:hypothetical protein
LFFQVLYAPTQGLMTGKSFKIPLPTILKPRERWTGKQVISCVLEIISK